jgi:hypothetical protein
MGDQKGGGGGFGPASKDSSGHVSLLTAGSHDSVQGTTYLV